MILCAGLGTRLLPITSKLPKPLVPILNLPNVLHIAEVFARAGINEIIVNTHHLASQVETYLSHVKFKDVKFYFSRENEVLLGTGGGVKKAESFFEGEPFVLSNCDFVTNLSLEPFIERHLHRKAIATMVLFKDEVRQPLYSRVGIDAKDNLCALPKYKTSAPVRGGIFTGMHILTQEIFQYLEEKPSGINDVLYPALMKECPTKIYGDFANTFYWYDTGDFHSLLQATESLLQSQNQTEPLIGKNCVIGKGVKLGPCTVIGNDCTIGEGSEISHSVLLDHSSVPANSKLFEVLHWEKQSISAAKST